MQHARLFTVALLRTAAVAVTLGALASCGGGSDPSPTPAPPAPAPAPAPTPTPPPAPTALPFKVMPPKVSLEIDGEGALTASGATSGVTWVSSDPAVATVDAAGRVTAKSRGTATITATSGTNTSTATIKVWMTTGATPDATSDALIDAALAAGTINAEQAVLYRVYAMFGDARLPSAFDGAPTEQGSGMLRNVSGQMTTFSQPTQDLLRPFFIPPIYPESWYGQQVGLPAVQAARADRPRAAATGTPAFCTADIVSTYIQFGLLKRRTTAHYNIYVQTGVLGDAEAAVLDEAAAVIEQIDASLTGLLNRRPKSDAAEPCNGGDGAYDIYITWGITSSDLGLTTAYPGRCEDTPSFISLNALVLSLGFGGSAPRAQAILRTVLAHELTHAIQFGMDRAASCSDYNWIDEATAQWAPDHVFPNDNLEDGITKSGARNAARTGKYYLDYLKGGHRNAIDKANGYSTYIYFQFLARKYGAGTIKAQFDAWASNGSVDSLDAALKAVGTSLKEAWPEFGKALWNDVRGNVLNDLRSWDGYDYGMADEVRAAPVTLINGRATVPLLSASGGKIAPRSVAYQRLTFPDEISPVLLTIPLGGLPQGPYLKLNAVKKIGGQWRAPEDWTGEPLRYLCRDTVDERIDELVLIFSNSDPDPNAAPAVLPSQPALELNASNVGCWKWQGSATRQINTDNALQRGSNTARAIDLVLEQQGAPTPGILSLNPAAGSTNGLFSYTQTIPPCEVTITGPTKVVVPAEGFVQLNLDVNMLAAPDRRVRTMIGTSFIDSTQVAVCNGQTTITPAPSTGWAWLLYPVTTQPLFVSTDGKTIAANYTELFDGGSTVHNFSFTAMRE